MTTWTELTVAQQTLMGFLHSNESAVVANTANPPEGYEGPFYRTVSRIPAALVDLGFIEPVPGARFDNKYQLTDSGKSVLPDSITGEAPENHGEAPENHGEAPETETADMSKATPPAADPAATPDSTPTPANATPANATPASANPQSPGEALTGTVEAIDPTETVAPANQNEVVLASGKALSVWQGTASTFVPGLSADLTPEERKGAVRTFTKEAFSVDDRLNLVNGELLWEINQNKYWSEWDFTDPATGEERKYASFEEYLVNELGSEKRKAKYLISIYQKFCIDLDLPVDTLRGLEWSKAKELVSVINQENASELLDACRSKSLREIQDMVRAMRGKPAVGNSSGNSDPESVVKRFVLSKEEGENVDNALKVARGMANTESDNVALNLICAEFVATSVGEGFDGATAKLDNILQTLEGAFGVKLKIEAMDEDRYGAMAAAGDAAPQA